MTSFFKGQVALVTGAGSGIGRAITLKLAEGGATVGMIDKSLHSLRAVSQDAKEISRRSIPFKADLERDQEIHGLVNNIRRSFKGIDILVHCAGVISLGSIAESGADNFDLQYRINVRAPYLLTRALLPLLRARKGQVVFINSSSGLRAKAGTAGYSASKHALKALADALRDEVNPDGLRVISVYPGRTATPMQKDLSRAEGIPYIPEDLMQPDDVAQVVCDALGLNRTAEVTDVSVRPAKKTR